MKIPKAIISGTCIISMTASLLPGNAVAQQQNPLSQTAIVDTLRNPINHPSVNPEFAKLENQAIQLKEKINEPDENLNKAIRKMNEVENKYKETLSNATNHHQRVEIVEIYYLERSNALNDVNKALNAKDEKFNNSIRALEDLIDKYCYTIDSRPLKSYFHAAKV